MTYNYTKPRVPVAATYSGPGPSYCLPSLVGQKNHDPRSVHSRGPAYPFGLSRSMSADENTGPGPAYIEAKLYRTGRETTPAYTMCGKRRDNSTERPLPGPTDYVCVNPDMVSGKQKAPAYSFGLGRKERDSDLTPGPNQYVVSGGSNPQDSKTKRSPSYTIIGRRNVGSFHEDLNKTPGPGAYGMTNIKTYLNRPPAYTISGRNPMPGDATEKPGPWSYSTDKVWVHKREPPRFSFGIRHSPYEAPLIVNVQD